MVGCGRAMYLTKFIVNNSDMYMYEFIQVVCHVLVISMNHATSIPV